MNPWRKDTNKPMVLGHRGAMGLAPENTIAGIKEGIKHNVNMVEIDVQLSKDKKLIVIHDHTVNRTTTGTGYVCELTSAQIKKLDAGIKFDKKFKGEKVPLLEEVIQFLLNHPNVKLNIEIKNGPVFYPSIEEEIVKIIDEYKFYNQVIISSFDHLTLKKIKDINPEIYTGLLYSSRIYNLEKYVEELQLSAIHPLWFYLTPEIVDSMHKMNIAVNTWLINDMELYNRFSKMDIDSFGTNFPNLFNSKEAL